MFKNDFLGEKKFNRKFFKTENSDEISFKNQTSNPVFKISLTNTLFKENFSDIPINNIEDSQSQLFIKDPNQQFFFIKEFPKSYGNVTQFDISGIIWVKQHKNNKITDRYIIRAHRPGFSTFYTVADIFYLDECYIIKFLGIYNNIGKLANINFKFQGNIEAQSNIILKNIPVFIIPEYCSFAKRSNPFYFWLDLFGTEKNNF